MTSLTWPAALAIASSSCPSCHQRQPIHQPANHQLMPGLACLRPHLQVTSLGRVVPADKASKTVYCHLACALWVPEIEVSDHSRMAGVRLDKLTAVRAKLRCELCKQAGGAAV